MTGDRVQVQRLLTDFAKLRKACGLTDELDVVANQTAYILNFIEALKEQIRDLHKRAKDRERGR